MDVTLYAIATTDPRLASSAAVQAGARRDTGVKVLLEVAPASTIEQMCGSIGEHFMIGSSWRLQELHICAHGNPAYGFVDIGTGLRAAQTRAFRAIRRCWINTGQLAHGAHIEMNVCSAAGYGMRPVMMGLAEDAGVPVRACPVPILVATLFAPAEGFRTFYPGSGGISGGDYVDPGTALGGQR